MNGRNFTDKEIDLLVQGFLLPPPFGFTEREKKDILGWIKSPSWLERINTKTVDKKS